MSQGRVRSLVVVKVCQRDGVPMLEQGEGVRYTVRKDQTAMCNV